MSEHAVVRVDPGNADQLRLWDGSQGAYWTERAERFNEGVAGYRDRFFAAASIGEGARVLDIGCGSGQTTRDAARLAGSGTALGVDLSSEMIELARDLAAREQVGNAEFLQADAQVHAFAEEEYDVVISRHGVMFFGDPKAAFANIARGMRRGGRMILLTWQPFDGRNEWFGAFRAALAAGREIPAPQPNTPSPVSLSEPDRVRELLTGAGLTDVRLHGLSEPMYFGRDTDDACEFITGQLAGMLEDLDADAEKRAIEDLRADMAEHCTADGVFYDSATWLIEARRP